MFFFNTKKAHKRIYTRIFTLWNFDNEKMKQSHKVSASEKRSKNEIKPNRVQKTK